MISLFAAGLVAVSATFGVVALSYNAPEATEKNSESETVSVKEEKPQVEIELNKTFVKGTEGKKFTLKVKTNSDKKVSFRSSDKKVAVVSAKGTVTFKGEGNARIVAEVDGEKAVCKVKVNKKPGNTISDSEMANIASSIGRQTDYTYGDSSIMCSAYSFAYAYKQVTGVQIDPISVWCDGCTWDGGTYNHFYSEEDMLANIKSEIDRNKACVGLLSTGAAYTHYVTFYGYTGDGTSLSDFEILDPWEGNLTTGAGYSYSWDGYDTVTIN